MPQLTRQIAAIIRALILGVGNVSNGIRGISEAEAQRQIGNILDGINPADRDETGAPFVPSAGSRGQASNLIGRYSTWESDPTTGGTNRYLTTNTALRNELQTLLGAEDTITTAIDGADDFSLDDLDVGWELGADGVPATAWQTTPEAEMGLPGELQALRPGNIYESWARNLPGIPAAAESTMMRLQPRYQAQYELQYPFNVTEGTTETGLRPGYLAYLQDRQTPLTGDPLRQRLQTISSALGQMGTVAQNEELAQRTKDIIEQSAAMGGQPTALATAAQLGGQMRKQYGAGDTGLQRQYRAAALPYHQKGYSPDAVTNIMNMLRQGWRTSQMTNPWQQFLPYAMASDPGTFGLSNA